MPKAKGHLIQSVQEGSIAEELEIAPGDRLLLVNGAPVEDVFDYHYAINDDHVVLLIEKPDKEQWELEIEKDPAQDIGLFFGDGLMDEAHSCRNKCIFCFIDQMPPGMRKTLYFKDDDARLSFLQGNYITMTNMSEKEFSRILRYKFSPINISVHTTNPALRCRMLRNRFAGDILKKIKRLADHQIEMNSQVVLCKGINDGAELTRTVKDLARFYPQMRTLSVVPVGLTKYRDGLPELLPFSREDAKAMLRQIGDLQMQCLSQFGSRFVFPSDEWFLLAEEEIPSESYYEGYLQLENGVGMVRLLLEEVREDLKTRRGDGRQLQSTVVTGLLAAPVMEQVAQEVKRVYPNLKINVKPIRNDFFGPLITVAGLLTGQDILAQLSGCSLGDQVLLPISVLRNGEDVLLDDVTVGELENALQTHVCIVKSDGSSLVDALVGEGAFLVEDSNKRSLVKGRTSAGKEENPT